MKVLISLCCLVSAAVSAQATLPSGCQPIVVQGEAVSIKANKAKLIFINNLAKTDLWITHPVDEPSASAGWTTRLQSGNWSALTVNKGPFVLNCIESKPGHEQQIPCEGAITVCQWNKMKMPASAQSTFWVAEDKTLAELITAVGGRGFVIPTAPSSD